LGTGRGPGIALSHLVLSLADNKQLLGLRYAEWCTAAPSLEADIAAAAMGLDDIGHSRVLYGCLPELGADPRGEARQTDASSYLNVPYLDAPWQDWTQFVAANAVLDTAFTLMLEALAGGSVEVLRTRLGKMLQEEHYHFLHGRSWLREGKAAAGPALERAVREAVEWFGPDGGDLDELHRAGQLSVGVGELRRRLSTKIEHPDALPAVDWTRWDRLRRRGRPGGIDGPTFQMLRGLEERKFMPHGAERKDA